jgi:hypothetical protein
MPETVPINDAALRSQSYVNWGAIIAGALLASIYSFVLLTFGAAVGLSLTSPFEPGGAAGWGMLLAAGLWLLWVQVTGFGLGAYVAGRMRPRLGDASEHEVEVRDGVHGLLVWAVGALLGVTIAIHATTSVIGAAGQAIGGVASTAAQSPASQTLVDSLFRTNGAAPSQANEAIRAEAGRILASAAASGSLSTEDRAYLGRVVASQTDLTPEQAEARINQLTTQAAEAAKQAKHTAVITGFITAASLLISAVAAWWAADLGGDHRDRNVDLSRYGRWRLQSGVAGPLGGSSTQKRRRA